MNSDTNTISPPSTPFTLRSMKELAWDLNRSYSYICAMKKAGFPMPGGRATIDEARAWLRANPGFTFASVYVHKDYPSLKKRPGAKKTRRKRPPVFPT